MSAVPGTRRSSAVGPALRGPLLVLGLAAGCVLVGVAVGRSPLQEVGSGLLTLALMGLACLYAMRRRTMRFSLWVLRPFHSVRLLRPFLPIAKYCDRVQSWRFAHLVVGVLWALALWWHMGASRGTWLETGLVTMCGLVLGSGFLGAFMQFWVPRSMLGILEREVRVEDVEARRRAIFVEAEEKILGGSERLVDTYLARVRPVLQGDSSPMHLLEATLRGQDPGAQLRGSLLLLLEGMDDPDRAKFRELIDLAEQKGRLDLNLYHLELSVGWLMIHDALVLGTVALVVLHLLSVAYF